MDVDEKNIKTLAAAQDGSNMPMAQSDRAEQYPLGGDAGQNVFLRSLARKVVELEVRIKSLEATRGL